MTSPAEKLTSTQVRDASPADWRQILGRIVARFRTGDFATGLALVGRIGAAAEDADHYPDIQLTDADVIVKLTSHDVQGITSRDLDLAGQISRHAAELGIGSDTAGLTQLDVGLDTAHGPQLAPFYAALLGSNVEHGELLDPSGQVPSIWWQEPSDDQTWALPEQPFEQRWHFDVWVAHDEGERRLQAVLDAGGRLVSDRAAPAFWVVEDADGNRSCICTPAGRGR